MPADGADVGGDVEGAGDFGIGDERDEVFVFPVEPIGGVFEDGDLDGFGAGIFLDVLAGDGNFGVSVESACGLRRLLDDAEKLVIGVRKRAKQQDGYG
jgi:hypothetical protein